MGVTIVVCPCGRRLKAAGLVPGARGRCPDCGRSLRIPGPKQPSPAAADRGAGAGEAEDEWNWQGTYELNSVAPVAGAPEAPAPSDPWADEAGLADAPSGAAGSVSELDDEWNWQGSGYDVEEPEVLPAAYALEPQAAPAGASLGYDEAERALLPVRPELRPRPKTGDDEARPPAPPWWPPRLLYPLRAAEGVLMAVALGLVFWVLATLVPEYCLAVFADSVKLGTPSMGRLVALISSLPSVVLVPGALVYWLQYLGRVLAASAEGEAAPPRPPDRNFEGLFAGLGCWLVWLLAGLGVALVPLGAYLAASSRGVVAWSSSLGAALGLIALPYAAAALLLAFLHDDARAVLPPGVLGALPRLGLPFLAACLTVAGILALVPLAFDTALRLREQHFYAYLFACLGAWIAAPWLSFVAIQTLGAYYAPRAKRLKWRRVRIRWGAS